MGDKSWAGLCRSEACRWPLSGFIFGSVPLHVVTVGKERNTFLLAQGLLWQSICEMLQFDTCHERKAEIAAKLERIRRMLDENDLQGVLLTNHDNFSCVGNVPQQLVEKYQACLEIETAAMGQTLVGTPEKDNLPLP